MVRWGDEIQSGDLQVPVLMLYLKLQEQSASCDFQAASGMTGIQTRAKKTLAIVFPKSQEGNMNMLPSQSIMPRKYKRYLKSSQCSKQRHLFRGICLTHYVDFRESVCPGLSCTGWETSGGLHASGVRRWSHVGPHLVAVNAVNLVVSGELVLPAYSPAGHSSRTRASPSGPRKETNQKEYFYASL